jgi:5-oxoprolinase (ATP-hydrolysing)
MRVILSGSDSCNIDILEGMKGYERTKSTNLIWEIKSKISWLIINTHKFALFRSLKAKWQFWIDRIGTFTCNIACIPDWKLITNKLLSGNPYQHIDAVMHEVRQIIRLHKNTPIPAEPIESIKMLRTVYTNALVYS